MTSLLRSFLGPRAADTRAISPTTLWGADLDWHSGNTIAGVRVDDDTAFQASTVWACVRILSNDISTLPLDAFRSRPTGKQPIDLPAWVERPDPFNPNATRIDWVRDVIVSLLTDGNAFLHFEPSVRLAESVHVWDPYRVRVKLAADRTVQYLHQDYDRPFGPDEVVHITWIRRPGQLRGMGPVQYASDSLALAIAAEEYGAAYFGNGATLSGYLAVPKDVDLPEEEARKMLGQFRARYTGARRAHAVGALTAGVEFKPLASTNQESQFLELRKHQRDVIASEIFGIPPHMVGSTDAGAVGLASIEQRSIEYVQHAVAPLVTKIETSLTRALPGPSTYWKFNLSSLLRGDVTSRYAAYATALQNRFMVIDEVRALEDLPPFGGADGGFLNTPNNSAPAPTSEPAADEETA